MPIFQLTPLENNADRLSVAVRATLSPEDILELQNKAGWVVRFPGTTVELSNRIGITNPTEPNVTATGSVMVSNMVSYFGRGPTTMWEWLKTRFEKP